MRFPLKSLWMELRSLTNGATYPAFITQAHPDTIQGESLPVFMFHSVTTQGFAAQMRFLADNGYITLDADAAYAGITGAAPLPRLQQPGQPLGWAGAVPLPRRPAAGGPARRAETAPMALPTAIAAMISARLFMRLVAADEPAVVITLP